MFYTDPFRNGSERGLFYTVPLRNGSEQELFYTVPFKNGSERGLTCCLVVVGLGVGAQESLKIMSLILF
jgi:hypothetical protein